MRAITALIFGMLVLGNAMAVTEPECWAQSNACWANCCETNGFEWDWAEEGCYVPEDVRDEEVMEMCGYCDEQYVNCVAQIENGGGCCMAFVVLLAVLGATLYKR